MKKMKINPISYDIRGLLTFAVVLMSVASPSTASTVEDVVRLTMNSSRHCVGASWTLQLDNAAPNAAIRLTGTANDIPWAIPQWADTDARGNFSTGGIYAADAAAKYTLRAEIMGSISNTLPVEVLNCGWRDTGPLIAARFQPTATLLSDGKVLVAGGYSGFTGSFPRSQPDQWQDSAELYDPVSETWRVTGKLNITRIGHTATLLANGKVLIAGGWRFGVLNSAELYDPATGAWSPAGTMRSPRSEATATLLPDGKVLVAGGYNDYPLGQGSAELYDPITGSWTPTGNLTTARGGATATLLQEGKVLMVGGSLGDHCTMLANAELYDPATGKWRATGSMSGARYGHRTTLLPDGRVLVSEVAEEPGCGPGHSPELYDPATEKWSDTRDPAILAWSPAATFTTASGYYAPVVTLQSGKILQVGGSGASLYDGGFEVPSLTMNSTTYCVGDPWGLTVTRAARAAPVSLIGVSNSASWKISRWSTTNAEGSFKDGGTMASGTEGTHTLRVEISGVWSDAVSFQVLKCKP